MKTRQVDLVRDHLQTYGGITQESAWALFRCSQLRTRVLELRRLGWPIATCDGSDMPSGSHQGHYLLLQWSGGPPVFPTMDLGL